MGVQHVRAAKRLRHLALPGIVRGPAILPALRAAAECRPAVQLSSLCGAACHLQQPSMPFTFVQSPCRAFGRGGMLLWQDIPVPVLVIQLSNNALQEPLPIMSITKL